MSNKVSVDAIETRKKFEKYKKLIRRLRRGSYEKVDNKEANDSVTSGAKS